MEKERIIIDCDPGHDDAYALALAKGLSDRIKTEAIVATYGNQSISRTLTNALNLSQALNFDCPVYAGSPSPLIRKRVHAGNIHGETGLDGPVFPECTRFCRGNGIQAILNIVRENPGEITFVSLGPMTDLAVCLKADPLFSRDVKRIVVMGGSMGNGNATPYAEFNVYADPEAAQIVYSGKQEIVMFGLDVTRTLEFDEKQMKRARNLPDSDFKKLFIASIGYYGNAVMKLNGEYPAMHDPSTIAYLADPSLFGFERHNIRVELRDEEKYGQTVAGKADETGNVLAGVRADKERFWDFFFETLSVLQ
ncbi:MAG: nucleoside hydrolase [Sphaerochaeta sp.]